MTDDTPSPYCKTVPTLLKAWDSTALRLVMECPRKYYLAQVKGYRTKGSVDVEFGRMYHASLEVFDKAIVAGQTRIDAMDAALDYALKVTHTTDQDGTSVFWGGQYVTVWICTDVGPPFKSGPRKSQANAAKRCLNAKTSHLGHAPGETCSICSKPLIEYEEWYAQDHRKNRNTLIRAVVTYCDTQSDGGGVQPYVFPDGRPAVELHAELPLPITSPDGDVYSLVVNLDGICTGAGETFIRERKTTKNNVGKAYFDRYEPDLQVDNYDLAAWLLYPELHIRSVMMEATQLGAQFARVQRHLVTIPKHRREEWFEELQHWIKTAEAYAISGHWPKNTSACQNGGGCQFRQICRLAPSARAVFLKEQFEIVQWNPLQVR